MEEATAVLDAPASAPASEAAPSTPDTSAPSDNFMGLPSEDDVFNAYFEETFRGDGKPEGAEGDAGEVAKSIEQANAEAKAWLEQDGKPTPPTGEAPAPVAESQPAQAPVAPAPVTREFPKLDYNVILPPLPQEQYEQLPYNHEAQRAREVQLLEANAQMVNNLMLNHFMPMLLNDAMEGSYNVVHLAALEADYGDLLEKAPDLMMKATIEAKREKPSASSRDILAMVRQKIDKIVKVREQAESGRVDVTQRGRFNNPVNGGRGATRPQGGGDRSAPTSAQRYDEVMQEIAGV